MRAWPWSGLSTPRPSCSLCSPLKEVSPLPITDLDHTTTGAAHHYKPTDVASVEQAFYALVASTWRQHIGRGNPGGVRQRVLTVLLGDGVTLASEVMTLAKPTTRL